MFILLMLRVTGLVELFLIRNSTPNAENTRSGQQRRKVVLHLESSPRIGDYGTLLDRTPASDSSVWNAAFLRNCFIFLGGGEAG